MATAALASAGQRVVEVEADLGEGHSPRWRYGSGWLVDGRTVLTAAHAVVDACALWVRGPDKDPRRAEAGPAHVGHPRWLDLALLDVPEPPGSAPLRRRRGRESGHADDGRGVLVRWLSGLSGGFPWWGPAVRETAQVDGRIPPLSGLVEGTLSLQVTQTPRPLPAWHVRLAESEWSGMSGGCCVRGGPARRGSRRARSRRGPSDITVTPLAFLNQPKTAPENASEWWKRLGVGDPLGLVQLPVGGTHAQEESSQATHPADATRYVLLLDACLSLADLVWYVDPLTIEEKRRVLRLVTRHRVELVHDSKSLAQALDEECPGAAHAIRTFLRGPDSTTISRLCRHFSTGSPRRSEGEHQPDSLHRARSSAGYAFHEGREKLDDLLQTSRTLAIALAHQRQVGVWQVLGFESDEEYRDYVRPTMKSATYPGELGEDVLRRLLEEPLNPRDLEDEGLPKSLSIDLLNRLLGDHWARWEGEAERIALTQAGARLVRKRLAEWDA